MIFTNANIFRPEGVFRKGSFTVENGCFTEITDAPVTVPTWIWEDCA